MQSYELKDILHPIATTVAHVVDQYFVRDQQQTHLRAYWSHMVGWYHCIKLSEVPECEPLGGRT